MPARSRAYELAAGSADVPHILNGLYSLRDQYENYQFEIRTVLRSRINPDMVGKRVLRVRRGGSWEAFAFLGRESQVVLWPAYSAMETGEHLSMARFLLRRLDDMRPVANRSMTTAVYSEDDIGNEDARWELSIDPRCRYCNNSLVETGPTFFDGSHVSCSAENHAVAMALEPQERLVEPVRETAQPIRRRRRRGSQTAMEAWEQKLLRSEINPDIIR